MTSNDVCIKIGCWSCDIVDEAKADHIEMWYDRSLRLWTLYPVDAEGNQLSKGAEYAVRKAEALATKAYLEKEWGC